MTRSEARELATRLAVAATDGGEDDWATGSASLETLDGRSWLLLDQAARTFTYADGTPVSGLRGWMGTPLGEPSGYVAAITSLHVDGRFRERATQVLATADSPITTYALSVRLLDHVPQVRVHAWEALRPRLGLATAALVLDVLLAGRNRQHGEAALTDLRDVLLTVASDGELVRTLTRGGRRPARRWAFILGHQREPLRLPEEQRSRIAAFVPASGLDEHHVRIVAFHSGIKLPPNRAADREGELESGGEPSATRKRPWLRLVRRR